MTLLSLSLRRRFTSDVATRFSIWLVGVVLGVVRMVSTVICVGHADHVACRVEKGSQDLVI